MQEGADPVPPPAPAAWAGRPPAMIAQAGRISPDGLQLGGAQLLGGEAEHADAPGPVAELRGGLGRASRAALLAGCQRERDERQRAAVGDRRGERGLVADPGHRPLGDGHPYPEGRREGSTGLEQVGGVRAVDGVEHRRAHSA